MATLVEDRDASTAEAFRPILTRRPMSAWGRLKNALRLVLDLQNLSIARHVTSFAKTATGKLIDVGCGNAPYRRLFEERDCDYQGIDIYEARSKFDVQDPGIVFYDGKNIPFPDASFDSLICVEVLEHVSHFQDLVDEMHRVMRPGARGCVTVPWTMRYHYVPYDYFRYTPSTLRTMFANFRQAKIVPRGTDVTVAGYKIVILWLRQFFPTKPWHWCLVPVGIALTPLAMIALAVAHLSMLLKVGNPDDPLGYTVFVTR